MLGAAACVVALAGCALSIPTDPNGTLDEVTGGTLRAGVSPNPPWTSVEAGVPDGVDVELVVQFAEEIDAVVEWTYGGEEHLIGQLERGELDLVLGGITDDSPWEKQAAITTPFVEVTGPDGRPEKHVFAAPLGENAFLLRLERFLLDQEVEVP